MTPDAVFYVAVTVIFTVAALCVTFSGWLKHRHVHKWKVVDKAALQATEDKRIIGEMWTLQCEDCGNIKRERAL